MSHSPIVVTRLPSIAQPKNATEARRILATEYGRIFHNVWPAYTELIGEHGIAQILANEHTLPYAEAFPLHAAHATALRLGERVAQWLAEPPQDAELDVIKAFYEINSGQRHDQGDLDLALGKLMLHHARFGRLMTEIPLSDPVLVGIWQRFGSTATRVSSVADPRTWLWQPEPDVDAAPAKPKIIN